MSWRDEEIQQMASAEEMERARRLFLADKHCSSCGARVILDPVYPAGPMIDPHTNRLHTCEARRT